MTIAGGITAVATFVATHQAAPFKSLVFGVVGAFASGAAGQWLRSLATPDSSTGDLAEIASRLSRLEQDVLDLKSLVTVAINR